MLRHVVLFRFRDDVTAEQVRAIDDGLGRLPALIPELRAYRFGSDLGIGDGTWSYAVTADFDDADGWRAYDLHPEHVAVRTEAFAPIVTERAVVRFEI
jgi:hypothetical protein